MHPLPVTKMCIQLSTLDRSFVSISSNKSSRLYFFHKRIFPNIDFYLYTNKNFLRKIADTNFELDIKNSDNPLFGGLKDEVLAQAVGS